MDIFISLKYYQIYMEFKFGNILNVFYLTIEIN